MYFVWESKNDVIVYDADNDSNLEKLGFKMVGSRKTLKGAERLAEKRSEL